MKRKIFTLVLSVLMAAMMLAGCGKKVECDFCGEEKRCETVKFLGEDVNICGDCRDDINELFG